MIRINTPIESIWVERVNEDEPQTDDNRTPFQHDKDRIIHSTAFRRLQYKTQVYVIHEGDLYRTRLTHSLEVAQIARGLASNLGADSDLAEAISLAHDLGHAPFGHIGGDELQELLSSYKIPFNHNIQSYRIVTWLEERYSRFKGLNLTHATLEGILRHRTLFDPLKDIRNNIPKEIKKEILHYLDSSPAPSAETQIVSVADTIAYAAHDIEDALAVGLISWEKFKTRIKEEAITFVEQIIEETLEAHISEYKKRDLHATDETIQKMRTRTLSRLIIESLIRAVCQQTELNKTALANDKKDNWVDVRKQESSIVVFADDIWDQVEKLVKMVLLKHVYQEPRVMMMQKAKRIIEVLFQSFMDEPEALPNITRARLPRYFDLSKQERKREAEQRKLAQVVGDYISGMTDKYAMDMYQLLTQAYEKAL